MKFEKINNDKIKVTINKDDLSANDMDFHSFMSNSKETHSLFLSVLERAEKDYNFSTKDYSLRVETVALADGNFILTITRVLEPSGSFTESTPTKKKLKVARKIPKAETASVIYKFNTFEDFCDLANFIYAMPQFNYADLAKDFSLYKYNDKYYLSLSNINKDFKALKGVFASITEFGTYVDSAEIFEAKLFESGSIIFKNNAIENCIKHFISQ